MSTEAEKFAPTTCRSDPGAARHRDLPDRGVGQRPHQPDQRAPGHDRAQRASQPGPGAAGQRERDPLQQAPQLRRATLMPPGQPGQLLSKGRHRARRGIAPHPPDRQLDLDRPAAAGQIPQAAPVPVMNPRRRRPAARAGQQPCARAGRDPHPAEVNTSGRPPLVLTSQPQAECLVRRDARHRYQNGRRVACLL